MNSDGLFEGYTEHLIELDALCTEIQMVSGFTVKQLLDMFLTGCEISEPKSIRVRERHKEYDGPIWAKKKEATAMQVSYNGFTGELVKLERSNVCDVTITVSLSHPEGMGQKDSWRYDLSIYDSEKQVTHSFTGVKLEDVKFIGGTVSFS